MLTVQSKIKVSDKANLTVYKEGSEIWNTLCDCLHSMNSDNEVTVLKMMEYNDLPLSYYTKNLPTLVANKDIEIILS